MSLLRTLLDNEWLPRRNFDGSWDKPPAWRMARFPPPAQGNGPGRHTRLWLELSWCLGDGHADRICGIVDVYVRAFGLRGRGWR